MPTIKQKKLAKAIVQNLVADEPLNKQELVESVGYSELTADRRAGSVIASRGVKEELVSIGFNEETAKEVVAEILIAGENDLVKLKAAEIVFKVHGSYAPDRSINLNVDVKEPSDRIKQIAKELKDHAVTNRNI